MKDKECAEADAREMLELLLRHDCGENLCSLALDDPDDQDRFVEIMTRWIAVRTMNAYTVGYNEGHRVGYHAGVDLLKRLQEAIRLY